MAIRTHRKGFQFKPTDEDLMRYLLNKVTGSTRPDWYCDDLVKTADLYGSKEPWEIFGDRKEKEAFFFTQVNRVGKNCKTNQRVCRNVGNGGVWSNKGQKDWIYGRKGGILGYKRGFRYENRKGGKLMMDSDWLLKEYLLPDNVRRGLKEKYANYAICLLKRRRKKKMNKPPIEEELSAAAPPIVMNDEWLGQELDDDAPPCVPCKTAGDRAVDLPIQEDSCLQQEVGLDDNSTVSILPAVPIEIDDDDDDDLLDLSPVFVQADECSIPVQEINEWLLHQQKMPMMMAEDGDDGSDSVQQLSSIHDECSEKVIPPPPFDFSTTSSLEEGKKGGPFAELADFDFGDFRAAAAQPSNDHFAAWDDFGDFPWAAAGIQPLLPVSVV